MTRFAERGLDRRSGLQETGHAGARSACDTAMRTVIDEFTLTYPGIKNVEHEYLYVLYGADDAAGQGYLEKAYALGRQF